MGSTNHLLTKRKERKIVTWSITSKPQFLGSTTQGNLHTHTPAVPELECPRVTPKTRESCTHAKGQEGGFTLPSRNVTKSKTMAIKFQSSSQMPPSPGLVRHRTEPLPHSLSLGRALLPLALVGLVFPVPKGHTVQLKGGRRGIGVDKGLAVKQSLVKEHPSQPHQAAGSALANFTGLPLPR